jgi:ABC-type polysaccharide/polyol phosphate export permease
MLSHLKILYSYRELLAVYLWRELRIRYKQSVLGFIWAFLQPLSMMLLFTVIFTFVMPTKIANYPYPVFFYTALVAWNFFASSLNAAIPSLTDNYNLITKIYFPREILPLSGILLASVDYLIATAILFPMLFCFGITPTWQALWIFPLTALLFLFTTGVCLNLSAMNVYYRDVKLVINFMIQIWFFATPVLYSVDTTPIKIKLILFLNPLTFIVENLRSSIVEGRMVIWWQFASMSLFVMIFLVLSYRFFKMIENKFADVI